jgi:hypothetical protein
MDGETFKGLDEIISWDSLSSTTEKHFTSEEVFLRDPKNLVKLL